MRAFAEHRILASHLARKALVYIRQSSPGQVRANVESTRIQIGLREKAVALGWASPSVVDDDLGISAGGFADRPGFQYMLAQVALREVGIILCIDASRLSRNSKDWANLFELCGFFDTLIADVDQVYEVRCIPSDAVDHLGHPGVASLALGVIGLRGQELSQVTELLAELGHDGRLGVAGVDPQPVLVVGERQVGEDVVDGSDALLDLPDRPAQRVVQIGEVVAGQAQEALAPLRLDVVQAARLEVVEDARIVPVGGGRVGAEVRVGPALDERLEGPAQGVPRRADGLLRRLTVRPQRVACPRKDIVEGREGAGRTVRDG